MTSTKHSWTKIRPRFTKAAYKRRCHASGGGRCEDKVLTRIRSNTRCVSKVQQGGALEENICRAVRAPMSTNLTFGGRRRLRGHVGAVEEDILLLNPIGPANLCE